MTATCTFDVFASMDGVGSYRPPGDWLDATVVAGDAAETVARMKQESVAPIRSHGSLSLNWALLAAGLVDFDLELVDHPTLAP